MKTVHGQYIYLQGPFVAVDKLIKIIAEKCPQSFEAMLEKMAGMWFYLNKYIEYFFSKILSTMMRLKNK